MTGFTTAGRIAAAAVATAAWIGLGLYVAAEAANQDGNWLAGVWLNTSFLTDLSNTLLAVVLTGVALGARPLSGPHVVGWAIAAIATVGAGFWVIGGKLVPGVSAMEDILLHGVTPWCGLLFWLLFAPKGRLRLRGVLAWLAWPIGYFVYALARGALTGTYAYAFLDPSKGSWVGIGMTVGVIVVIFAVWAAILLSLDRLMRPRGV